MKKYKMTVSQCHKAEVIVNTYNSRPIRLKEGIDGTSSTTVMYCVSHNIPLGKYYEMSQPRTDIICCECHQECKTKEITLIQILQP